MNTLHKSFYRLLLIITILGFTTLFYFVFTEKMNLSAMFLFSLLTSLCLILIPSVNETMRDKGEQEYGNL